jgi:hypothetical protein
MLEAAGIFVRLEGRITVSFFMDGHVPDSMVNVIEFVPRSRIAEM